jgi:biopolymer transport protein ExbB
MLDVVAFLPSVLAQAAPAGGGAAPAGAPAAAVAAGSEKSLLTYVMHGGVLGFVMIVLSIVGLALMIRNAIVINEEKLAPQELLKALEGRFREGKFAEAQKMCDGPDAPFVARIVGGALARCAGSPFGMMEFRAAVEDVAGDETDRLHRMNDWIGIFAAIGPMLGLLGTVIGMIGAFDTIGTMSGAARSNQLAEFMAMALVNTAQGLVVAIPCTIAFAIFRRKIDETVSRIGHRLERLNAAMPAAKGQARISA